MHRSRMQKSIRYRRRTTECFGFITSCRPLFDTFDHSILFQLIGPTSHLRKAEARKHSLLSQPTDIAKSSWFVGHVRMPRFCASACNVQSNKGNPCNPLLSLNSESTSARSLPFSLLILRSRSVKDCHWSVTMSSAIQEFGIWN